MRWPLSCPRLALVRSLLIILTILVSPFADLVSRASGPSDALASPTEGSQPSGGYAGVWVWIDWGDPSMMSDLGVGWVRVSIHWDMVEANQGAFGWIVDQAIANASGDGKRQVLVNIRNNPGWAAASRCKVTTDAERSRLSSFVGTTV